MSEKMQKRTADNTAIEVSSVSKAFTARPVLNKINLRIKSGQSVCMLGVNGAGKTTLLRIIAGLLHPDNGHVHLCGHDINKEPEEAKFQLGVISHKSMIYPDLTVFENLSFFAALYDVRNCHRRIEQLLDDVSLSSYRYDKAGILSHGLLKRLAIARALIHGPSVLLADEPFAGLDDRTCHHLIEILNNFTANGGTILLATHDTDFSIRCCKRVIVLDKGQLIFDAEISGVDAAAFAQDYLSYARNKN
jgi:heme exporter protein A